MEKITKVTEADVGRVAVDEDSLYRVKILGLTQEESRVRVEYLPGSEYGNGRMVGKISESFNLAINGGGSPMYWEDSVEHKSFEANTPFTKWCVENGYDPEGEFVYDKQGTVEDHLCRKFSIEDTLKLSQDDKSFLPLFINQDMVTGYEDFNIDDYVVLKPKEKKENVAKPRFRKPRHKPPVRKKTDVTLEYVDGKLYHLKNVKFFSVNKDFNTVEFNFEKTISKGVNETISIKIDLDLIKHISILSPQGELELYLPEMWMVSKDLTVNFTIFSKNFN